MLVAVVVDVGGGSGFRTQRCLKIKCALASVVGGVDGGLWLLLQLMWSLCM